MAPTWTLYIFEVITVTFFKCFPLCEFQPILRSHNLNIHEMLIIEEWPRTEGLFHVSSMVSCKSKYTDWYYWLVMKRAVMLTHCSPVMPYGIDLGQHWIRYWLVVWWYQAITSTNVDISLHVISSVAFTCPSYYSVFFLNLKTILLCFTGTSPRGNELTSVSSIAGGHILCVPLQVTEIWVLQQ